MYLRDFPGSIPRSDIYFCNVRFTFFSQPLTFKHSQPLTKNSIRNNNVIINIDGQFTQCHISVNIERVYKFMQSESISTSFEI